MVLRNRERHRAQAKNRHLKGHRAKQSLLSAIVCGFILWQPQEKKNKKERGTLMARYHLCKETLCENKIMV